MKIKWALILMLMIWVPKIAIAQATDGREADHNELRALKDKATHALNSLDFETLAECFNSNFAFVTADQRILTSKESIERYYKEMMSGSKYKYALKSMSIAAEADILTRFPSENVGYCYGNCKNIFNLVGGIKLEMESKWTATVSKQAGEWKIDMVHVGINFLDNPVLNNQLSLLKTKNNIVGGIAIVCAIAFLGMAFYKRKKK